jgi:cyclic beta-1,2-glucan synthetase
VNVGTLIGYFAKHDEARTSLRELTHQGFNRIALVHKGMDGEVHIADPFLRRRVLGVALTACLCGVIGRVVALLLPWPQSFSAWGIFAPLAGAAIGALTALIRLRRSRCGVEPQVMRDHARWLVSGESVLILQAPVESLQSPVAMMREGTDIPPVLFVMHPRRERRAEARDIEVKLSPAQIQEHARRHAVEQQVDPRPRHSAELLKRLRRSRQWVHQVCADLTAASRLEQKATPAADWILDNEYILEGNVRDVLLNLPQRFYRQLPTLASDPYQGLPCIYGLAKDLASHTELRLDRENILAFIEAHQSVRTLTIGELWAIPQMLRIALIESIQNLAVTALADLRERQLADFWANRLIAANRRDANQLFGILAELSKAEPNPSPYFGAQLVGLLYDEAAALSAVQGWLERTLKTPLHEFHLREQNRQTREQISCGNAFTSLRQLALLDWREIFEKLSRVEQVLRSDPSGIYGGMDFATRDRCRRAVEELALAGGRSEVQVAERAIEQATRAGHGSATDDRARHVGAWLVGEGRAELARLLACRERLRYRTLEWIYRRHVVVYATGIAGFTALLFSMIAAVMPFGLSLPVRLGLVLLLLVPASQLAIEVVNYLITRFLPPRPLPKMDFEDTGIPDSFRTLVVVPMMLSNVETVRAEVEKLEIRYLANKEANLFFSLFTDYIDSATLSREDDSLLLRTAQACLEDLNRRHGGERFFLFHRERAWSESEQKFIGWSASGASWRS